MKLHRIEATSLNSLYDTQAIDLDADLGGASLFLVQGPTGSGKSTLMDAVSLALFGTTPRWAGTRSDQTIAEQVMSRGTGSCAAEVEFSKLDAERGRRVRYRARWQARRAYGHADGNMQATHRSLEEQQPDGTWSMLVSDHRAKFYEPAFDRVLEGFSAQDFQRSMLLAQGRFDAMLHADPQERAAILERLTDTSIYQRIGQRASQVRQAWAKRLGKLKARVEAISPIDEEQLAAARQAAEQGRQELERLDARRRQLEGQQGWLERQAKLAQQAAEARTALAGVAEREEQAAEPLQALAEHERCLPAFEARDEVARIDARLEVLQEQIADTKQKLPTLEQAVKRHRQAHQAAREQVQAVEAALEGLRQPVQRAQQATQRRADARTERAAASKRRDKAEARATEAEQAKQQAAKRLAAARQAQQQARTAHEACASDEPLAEALPALGDRFAGLRADASTLATDRQALDQHRAEAAQRAQQLEADQAAHQQATEQRVAPLRSQLEQATSALAELLDGGDADQALEALRTRELGLVEQGTALARAAQALETLGEHRAEAERARTAHQAAVASQQAATTRLSEARQGLQAAQQRLEQAQAALAPLERIAAHADERATLEAGDPCPLCGSPDHPWVDAPDQVEAGTVAGEIEAARTERASAEQQVDTARQAVTEAEKRLAAATTTVDTRAQALAQASDQVERQVSAAGEALAACALPHDADAAVVGEAIQANEQAREALDARRQALRGAQAAEADARDALEQAEAELKTEAERLTTEGTRLEQIREQLASRHKALDTRAEQLEQGRADLLAALGELGVAADTAEAALAAARERADAYSSAVRTLEQARTALETATAAHDSATSEHARAQQALAEATGELEQRTQAVEQAGEAHQAAAAALQAAWQQALAHDTEHTVDRPGSEAPPQQKLSSQQQVLSAARQRLEQAGDARDTAVEAASTARTRLETYQEQQATADEERQQAVEVLAQRLAALDLPDVDALDDRRLDDARGRELTDLRTELEHARTKAQATLDTVTDAQAQHRADRPDELAADATPEALTSAVEALAEQIEQVQQATDEARVVVKQAAETAQALETAREALAEGRERARVWLDLHDLIGVNNGQRFKEFAQALNLDQLLSRANDHLQRLDDRYRLRTVRDPDTRLPTLEFEIADRWRPGTTRSLKTLSGGESFLVSLALALGLSDLRTSSMPVETLLLDEGFGTLDPDTLDTALAALQQLQASGRQVGIISHVVGLQERIEARVLVEPLGDGRSRVRAETAPR